MKLGVGEQCGERDRNEEALAAKVHYCGNTNVRTSGTLPYTLVCMLQFMPKYVRNQVSAFFGVELQKQL